MDTEKRAKLEELQEEIYATIEKAWLFPSNGKVQGFLGTGPIMIVAERPSTGTFFRTPDQLLYALMEKYGAANAHLTDVIKSRGKVGAPYPDDIRADRAFFDRELEIVQPTRIITFGQKVHDLLQFTLAGSGIPVIQTWHYAYPGRYPNKRVAFEEQMRNACDLS
ncbi:MAG: uracil-DNA glycosylase family protein [Chloracidobacterium sp.]|nr:uracil-DNA glycosylase family protein [Chloracidobacterium sp.]